MANKTYFEVHKRASSFLEEKNKDSHALLFLLLEQLQWSKTDWLMHMNTEITAADEELVMQDLKLLLADHPPQYILGYADFYGIRLQVNEATLIPRPETEELVELILAKTADDLKNVIDIGTGSGAIAIALKKNRPNWHMVATDISAPAIQVAHSNAVELASDIEFIESDVFENVPGQFDIIVSNPPYIGAGEKKQMDASVLLFEPHSALFADNDGLAIYERIAREAQGKLTPHGKIFLEIGYLQRDAVTVIFEKAFPHKKVQVYQDMAKKDRMLVVEDPRGERS